MKTDGLFDIRRVEISFDSYDAPISLYLPADVHAGSKNHAETSFDDFLKKAQDDENQKIFLLMGDMIDAVSSSDRRVILHDAKDTTIDSVETIAERDTNNLIKKIKPLMRGKTIGVIGGNHFWQFRDGTTSEQRIARELDASYIGCAAFISLILRYRKTAHTHKIKIFAIHAASDSKLKKLGYGFYAHLVIGAHTHDGWHKPKPIVDTVEGPTGDKLIIHDAHTMRCKSFLKAWNPGVQSYAVDAAYSPTTIGCSRAIITPRRRCTSQDGVKVDDRWVDIETVS